MDEQGIETRGVKRILRNWNKITSITLTRRVVSGPSVYGGGGSTASCEYILTSPGGKVSIPLSRTVNEAEVRAFAVVHVPAHLLREHSEG